jgi:hypothetical protein
MSCEYHLITPHRPSSRAFVRTLAEAAGRKVNVIGDVENVDDYLNVSVADPDLWIEVEPPGHVEAIDLGGDSYNDVVLPDPDEAGCLWYAVANIPAGAPPGSAEVIWLIFRRLAADHGGIAIEP